MLFTTFARFKEIFVVPFFSLDLITSHTINVFGLGRGNSCQIMCEMIFPLFCVQNSSSESFHQHFPSHLSLIKKNSGPTIWCGLSILYTISRVCEFDKVEIHYKYMSVLYYMVDIILWSSRDVTNAEVVYSTYRKYVIILSGYVRGHVTKHPVTHQHVLTFHLIHQRQGPYT